MNKKANKTKKKSINIGIDLGTSNLLVYVDSEGIIFNEPSVIAVEYGTNNVIAIGHNASKMIGRGHNGIKIISPLNQGVISDMDSAKLLIEIALKKVESVNIDLSTSTLLVCCPSEVTQLEKNALIELALKLGVHDVFIEEEVKAGGIGAGLDIYSSDGTMVVDIGGGSTDIGVLSLGDIVVSESVRIAGSYIDNEIINYLQYKHGLLIGNKTAEIIKKEVGSLREKIEVEKTTSANGRDIISGLPKKIIITETEIRDVMIEPFESIASTILKVLQRTPPELSADIIVNGIVINGGGALIDGVDEFLKKRVTLDFHLAKNPMTAIVEGTKLLLKNRGSYFVKPTD
jgi:rod shape-determining protein MreB and related proteins